LPRSSAAGSNAEEAVEIPTARQHKVRTKPWNQFALCQIMPD